MPYSVLFLLVLWCISAQAQEPPEGWRVPTPETFEGQDLRARSPNSFLEAEGDFDGDGRTDRAALFIAADDLGEGLFVQLSSADSREWILAAQVEHRDPMPILGMGVSAVSPGRYATACGKGYWECRPGEPAELVLQRVGMSYFRFESAASIVYWDQGLEEFVRVWVSD